MSDAGESTWPPSPSARAAVASASATAKIAIQNAGTSSGVAGGMSLSPAILRSPRLNTV